MIVTGLKYWGLNVLIAIDQLGNALFLGAPDETISSRAGKARERGELWGCYLCKVLDWIDTRHCERTKENDEGANSVFGRLERDKGRTGLFFMEKTMTEFPEYTRFIKPRRRVTKVYLHCSAHDGAHSDNAATIDRWHKDRGWRGIGYHYFIRFDGTTEIGRSIKKIPAAQARHNRGSIAICVHGGQHSKPDAFTEDQYESLRQLCRDIDAAYKGKVTFHGHKEVSAKDCPVYDYKAILGLDKNGYLKKGVVSDDKLLSAGSKTIKAAKTNVDAGKALVTIGGVGAASEALNKFKDSIKSFTDDFGDWRTSIDTIADGLTWLAGNWTLFAVAAGGVVIWSNRQIIAARIKDELKIGRIDK